MNTQNQFEKDAQLTTNPRGVAAQMSEIKRELTDDEIASVFGGFSTTPILHAKPQPIVNPPGPVTGG